jgi:hypothetical protein
MPTLAGTGRRTDLAILAGNKRHRPRRSIGTLLLESHQRTERHEPAAMRRDRRA